MKTTILASIATASLLVLSAVAVACGSDDSSSSPGGAGGSGNPGGGGTPVGNGLCTNEKVSVTAGDSACEPHADAGSHCSTSGVTVLDGCVSEANCPQGQTCDTSAGTKDIEGTPTGVCRDPKTFACSPAGGSGGTSGGTGGSGSGSCDPTSSGDPTCDACVKSKCAAQATQAESDCAAFFTCWAATGCTTAGEQTCTAQLTQACATSGQAANTCEEQNCATECGAAVGDDVSGGDDTSGTDPQACSKLVTCCQGLMDESDQMFCASIASSNFAESCQMQLTQYQAENKCP